VFGQNNFGLAQVLRIPRGEAHKYIQSYFKRYARVRRHMDAIIADARQPQVVSTLLEVPTGEVDSFCPWVKTEMEAAYELRLPLVVEVHRGATWGDAH